jgi:hypothetical protein
MQLVHLLVYNGRIAEWCIEEAAKLPEDSKTRRKYEKFAKQLQEMQPGLPTEEESKAFSEKALSYISTQLKEEAVDYYKRCVEAEPKITADLCEIADGIGTELFGIKYRLKSAGDTAGNGMNIQYVADMIHGVTRMEGQKKEANVDVLTPLTKDAARNPVIPIGANGSLNFTTGSLAVPSGSAFELNISEISAGWLIEQLRNGSMSMLQANQKNANAFSPWDMDLSDGVILEGISDAGEVNGLKQYWLGDTPETATDPDQPLFCLRENEEADEAAFFRTSLRMLENGRNSRQTAIAIVPDSRNAGKSCLVFYDHSSADNTVIIISDAQKNLKEETASRMHVVLRGVRVSGSSLPAYSIRGRYLIMAECRNGFVNVLDGLYTASYDGNTFESPYTRITGIAKDKIRMTSGADHLTAAIRTADGNPAKPVSRGCYIICSRRPELMKVQVPLIKTLASTDRNDRAIR